MKKPQFDLLEHITQVLESLPETSEEYGVYLILFHILSLSMVAIASYCYTPEIDTYIIDLPYFLKQVPMDVLKQSFLPYYNDNTLTMDILRSRLDYFSNKDLSNAIKSQIDNFSNENYVPDSTDENPGISTQNCLIEAFYDTIKNDYINTVVQDAASTNYIVNTFYDVAYYDNITSEPETMEDVELNSMDEMAEHAREIFVNADTNMAYYITPTSSGVEEYYEPVQEILRQDTRENNATIEAERSTREAEASITGDDTLLRDHTPEGMRSHTVDGVVHYTSYPTTQEPSPWDRVEGYVRPEYDPGRRDITLVYDSASNDLLHEANVDRLDAIAINFDLFITDTDVINGERFQAFMQNLEFPADAVRVDEQIAIVQAQIDRNDEDINNALVDNMDRDYILSLCRGQMRTVRGARILDAVRIFLAGDT